MNCIPGCFGRAVSKACAGVCAARPRASCRVGESTSLPTQQGLTTMAALRRCACSIATSVACPHACSTRHTSKCALQSKMTLPLVASLGQTPKTQSTVELKTYQGYICKTLHPFGALLVRKNNTLIPAYRDCHFLFRCKHTYRHTEFSTPQKASPSSVS